MVYIENRQANKYKYLVLFIISMSLLVISLFQSIKLLRFDLFGLLLYSLLSVTFLIFYIKYNKYILQFDEEKIIIKDFKTRTIIIKDIDYYVIGKSNIRGMCEFLIVIKGLEYHFQSFHIKELVNALDVNCIKRIESINLHAINKQTAQQKCELILVLLFFVIFISVVPFFVHNRTIKTDDIYDTIKTYHIINKKRFAIFPMLDSKNIVEKRCVIDNKSMQIYLLAKYDDKEFNNEVNRLYNPSNTDYTWPKYYTSGYNYDTIVTIYKKNVFEYACLDFENKVIAYVYIENVRYDEICFDKKYAPTEFQYYYNELMLTKKEYNYYTD